MNKTKRPLSFVLAVLMIVSMFAAVPFTASAEDKVIGENVIFKLGDTIVLPGSGIYYVKDSERHPAQEIYSNGTITEFEGDEYSYSLMIDEWGIYARLDTFDYEAELNQGLSVLGIKFTGSGTESDPYLPKLALGVFESTWAGEGEGTEDSPWLINDVEDLRTLSANVKSGMKYTGKYLKLTADIDCGSGNWEPIGQGATFGGTFDGNGNTIIYHITNSTVEANGLFSEIAATGTVKNLSVSGSIFSSGNFNGGIAGKNGGLIINCLSAVDITTSKTHSGGIAGSNWLEASKTRYCVATGTLTWTGASNSYAYIGGITGENRWGAIDHCAMLGDVLAENTTESWAYAGILIGREMGSTTDCYYLNTAETAGAVNSDSVTAKTADELKPIGQAAIDAGYTVYGLALGGSLSNPDQEAADAVIALIDDIGTVEYTDASKEKIDAAREAYDALTDAQKALVSNADALTTAETTYAEKKAAAEALAEEAKDWQSVTIADQIEINFLLNTAEHANMQSITITYTNQDKETNPLDVDVTKLEKVGDYYKVPAVVAPAQIGDKITVTITTTDGSDPTTYETSIADYCKHLIANYDGENAAAVKALAAATLEYGQAANDYFFGTHYYHESDITTITNAVDADKAAEAKGLTNHMSVNANGKIQSISYMALTKPEFRFYVNPESGLTEADYVALNDKITVNCDNANVLEKVSVQFVKNGDAILLEVTGIEAANMDEIITITIDGFGTITFCGNDFANLLAKNASTQTLGTALYLYGLAAKACF